MKEIDHGMLSQHQKDDLNRAIADYLANNNYKETLEQFLKETQISADVLADKKNSGVLEKKWTAVVRLQKKISELEAALQKKDQEVGPLRPNTNKTRGSPTEWIPRPPEKFCLTGINFFLYSC